MKNATVPNLKLLDAWNRIERRLPPLNWVIWNKPLRIFAGCQRSITVYTDPYTISIENGLRKKVPVPNLKIVGRLEPYGTWSYIKKWDLTPDIIETPMDLEKIFSAWSWYSKHLTKILFGSTIEDFYTDPAVGIVSKIESVYLRNRV
jgi:hypothetical protein